MRTSFSLLTRKTILLVILTCVVLGGAVFLFTSSPAVVPEVIIETQPEVEIPVEKSDAPSIQTIGNSFEGRAIEAYRFGEGDTHLLFVGGIHGGYEWNSVLLAYNFIDYLLLNPTMIPEGVTVTVIPSLNPDGVYKVVKKEGRFTVEDFSEEGIPLGTGRFNARDVDLNRNFDCKWKPESTWRGNIVSAGTEPFSEPESLALRDFVLTQNPDAVIFWHSQSNAVYASECENGILASTRTLMDTYARGAGYPAVDSFDAYPISGDAEGWLASINIPAITVELKTHKTIEWEKNLAGIKSILSIYTKTAQ